MKRPAQAGLTDLLYGVALDMLFRLHCLGIGKGPSVPKAGAALGSQETRDDDTVNGLFGCRGFHAGIIVQGRQSVQ